MPAFAEATGGGSTKESAKQLAQSVRDKAENVLRVAILELSDADFARKGRIIDSLPRGIRAWHSD
eukprot:2159142-Lingulodinium_polyedra.AAC.1